MIPFALGGSLTLTDICKPCNDTFGSAYDVTLTDHLLIQFRRRRFQLAGQSGQIPDPIGTQGVLVDDPEVKVRLERGRGLRIVPSKKIVEKDGQREETLVLDGRDAKLISEVARKQESRLRKRHDGRRFEQKTSTTKLQQPAFRVELQMPAHDWLIGMTKIVYELAFLAIGATYLDDPLASRFRSFLQNIRPTVPLLEASGLPLQPVALGELDPIEGLGETHHYAAIFHCPRGLACEVRLFEAFGMNAIVSEQPDRHDAFQKPGRAIVFAADQRRHWYAV